MSLDVIVTCSIEWDGAFRINPSSVATLEIERKPAPIFDFPIPASKFFKKETNKLSIFANHDWRCSRQMLGREVLLSDFHEGQKLQGFGFRFSQFYKSIFVWDKHLLKKCIRQKWPLRPPLKRLSIHNLNQVVGPIIKICFRFWGHF